MTGKTHLQFGTITSIAVATTISMNEPVIFVGLSILGSIFPDIDTPKSMIGHCFPHISKFINKRIGHRTYMHDLLFWLICSSILLWKPIYLGFFFGIAGHLLLDACNPPGICFGYLFLKKKKKYNKKYHCYFGNIHLFPPKIAAKSNSIESNILTALLEIGICCYLFYIKIKGWFI